MLLSLTLALSSLLLSVHANPSSPLVHPRSPNPRPSPNDPNVVYSILKPHKRVVNNALEGLLKRQTCAQQGLGTCTTPIAVCCPGGGECCTGLGEYFFSQCRYCVVFPRSLPRVIFAPGLLFFSLRALLLSSQPSQSLLLSSLLTVY